MVLTPNMRCRTTFIHQGRKYTSPSSHTCSCGWNRWLTTQGRCLIPETVLKLWNIVCKCASTSLSVQISERSSAYFKMVRKLVLTWDKQIKQIPVWRGNQFPMSFFAFQLSKQRFLLVFVLVQLEEVWHVPLTLETSLLSTFAGIMEAFGRSCAGLV